MNNFLKSKDLEKIFNLNGDQITKSPLSELITYKFDNRVFFIKKYHLAGKGLRRYFGRSRLRAEYDNLKFFEKLSIPIPEITNFIEDRKFFKFNKGFLITEELKNVSSLADIAEFKSYFFKNKLWVNKVILQLARYTKILHDNNFVHNDLKWRNILVTLDLENPKVYFIDCPCGSKKIGPILQRGIIKDLACLDKVGKYILDKKTRLYFYKKYLGVSHLSKNNKDKIKKILKFFENRE